MKYLFILLLIVPFTKVTAQEPKIIEVNLLVQGAPYYYYDAEEGIFGLKLQPYFNLTSKWGFALHYSYAKAFMAAPWARTHFSNTGLDARYIVNPKSRLKVFIGLSYNIIKAKVRFNGDFQYTNTSQLRGFVDFNKKQGAIGVFTGVDILLGDWISFILSGSMESISKPFDGQQFIFTTNSNIRTANGNYGIISDYSSFLSIKGGLVNYVPFYLEYGFAIKIGEER